MQTIALVLNSVQGLDGKMKTLKRGIEALRCREEDINEELKDAELRSGKKRKRQVENWLRNVQSKRNEVQNIEQEIQERQVSLSLGNRVDRLIEEVADLRKQGRFLDGLLLDVHETRGELLLTTKLVGQKFEQNLEKIWEHLMVDEVSHIGIYGMGGVGKTTLVSHIHNRLLERSETFDHVCWITVSQDFSIRKLQNDIARTLNYNFSNEDDERKRAAELFRALTRRKKCVLILDDVWDPIPLDRVGIPNRVHGCKLILTTRKFDVCLKMECQEKIKVEPLFETEAWNLFSETLGQHTPLSPEVRDVAMFVAAKCSGLPLAIITMAATMRGVNDICEWRNVLEELNQFAMGQEDMENEVFPILKFSYSRLNDMKLQHCFLYCALYPEDNQIERNELIRYFIAEGLIDRRQSTWQAKFDKGHTMLNKLEKACLLESCQNGRCVKMHDLIREMALKVSHPRFMVKAGVRLRDMLDELEWTEDLEKVSLMYNEMEEIPRGLSPRCPRLSTLIFKGNNSLERIADSFFEHMHVLKVLDLSDTDIVELPNSVSDLENLTALLLGGCIDLTYVPPLGKLSVLQDLDLRRTRIKEVPQGVDRLVNLINLNMERIQNLEMIPSGTLGGLSHLQCLRLSCKLERAEELDGLRELEEFVICMDDDVVCFNRIVKSLQRCGCQLNKYSLGLYKSGHRVFRSDNEDKSLKVVNLRNYILERGVEGEDGILLIYDLQTLDIQECRFASSCLCDVFPSLRSNARYLKSLKLHSCRGLESILSLSHNDEEKEETKDVNDDDDDDDDDDDQGESCRVPFASLETLVLDELPDLRALCKSRELGYGVIAPPCDTFSNLQNLSISYCRRIKNMFTPHLLLQHLQNLKKITVICCKQMEEIVTVDDEGMGTSFFTNNNDTPTIITLPKLKKLTLLGLPKLKSIYEGILVCNSIQVISIKGCHNLKRLPFCLPLINGQPSAPTALKMIEIHYLDMQWWESLEWDHPNAKFALQPFVKNF